MKLFIQRLSILVVVAALSSIGLFAQVSMGSTNNATLKSAISAVNAGMQQGSSNINSSNPSNESNALVPTSFAGTYYVGEGETADFPNLTTAFGYMNTAVPVAGNVVFVIISDIIEPAMAVLNQPTETGVGGYTITIRPDGNTLRTISATATGGAVIKLVNADRVIIDGQANLTSETHKLHIKNLSVAESAALWIASTTGVGNFSDNVTAKNAIFSTLCADINAFGTSGIFCGASSSVTATPTNSNHNIVITNNKFFKAKRGVLIQGFVGTKSLGVVVRNNFFGTEDFDNLLFSGLELFNVQNGLAENNTIINTQTYGINLNSSLNTELKGNLIYNTNPSLYPGSTSGINVSSSNGSLINNNIVKHFRSYGIFSQNSNGIILENNTISNTGAMTNVLTTVSGIYLTSTANQTGTVRGNKVFDLSSSLFTGSANGTAYGINIAGNAITSSTTPIIIANNMIWNISGFGSGLSSIANNPYGIFIGTGRFINIYNNTVLMNGVLHSGNGFSGALYANNAAINNLDIQSNMFVNRTSTSSNATNYIYVLNAAAQLAALNNNIYGLSNVLNGKIGYLSASTTAYTDLTAWKTATSMDANSNVKVVPFATGLPYITSAVMADADYIGATLLTTTDINGVTRTLANNFKGAFIPTANQMQARYITMSNVGMNSMNMAWINGNGQGRLVLAATEYLTSSEWVELIKNLDEDVSNYEDVDGSMNSAEMVHYGSSMAYVMDNVIGAGRTSAISGLTAGTEYFFHVVEYKTVGDVTTYNSLPNTLNPRSIETLFDMTAPVVAPATNVAYDMFVANWTYTSTQPFQGFEVMVGEDLVDVGMYANEGAQDSYSFGYFALPNTAYSYKVRAKIGGLKTNWSALNTVNTYPVTVINGDPEVCIFVDNDYTLTLGNVVATNFTWHTNADGMLETITNGVNATWNVSGDVTLSVDIVDNGGNSGTVTIPVLVDPLPIMTPPAAFEVCVDAMPFTLSGALPIGGTYTGVGVTNNQFNPATAGLGDEVITYTYTNPATGCINSTEYTIHVVNPITVTVGQDFHVCVDAPAFALAGGMPLGGFYTGTGVANGQFDPATAGVGTHTITYTFNDVYGCTNSATFVIDVKALPVLTVPQNFTVCMNTVTTTLTAEPVGGTFSGAGVSGTVFTHATAGVGTHVITYNYTDAFGCANSATFSITIEATPEVTVENFAVCVDALPVTLTATPTGGTFTGTGVVDGVFTPSVAGAGATTITYTYTLGACTVVKTLVATVDALPVIVVPANMNVCIDNVTPITLAGATPAGGTYSGTNVVDGVFAAPSVAGLGTYTITYTYTNPTTTCTNSNTFTITVNPLPVIVVPANFGICLEAAPLALSGATPVGGTYTGTGVTANAFTASVAGLGEHIITYTYADAFGCQSSATFTITVNAMPVVTAPENMTVCIDTAPVVLAGGLPVGGTYTGAGVTANTFTPSVAGAGVHTITYTYADANSCSKFATFAITVTAAPAFTSQPVSVLVAINGTATFTATTAVVTDTYQWQVKLAGGTTWDNVPTATTNTLVLNNFTANMSGNMYRLVATGCTSTNSDAATLTIQDRPQTQAHHISWVNWGRTQITLNWVAGNGDGRIVVATKKAAWPLNGFVPVDGTTYTANTVFNPANEYNVVYSGTGVGPLTVTGLDRESDYTFFVFEYEMNGSIVLYNTTTATNNPYSRRTTRKDVMFDESSKLADGLFELSTVTPNPASENVSFGINVITSGNFNVELVNMLGEVVYSNNLSLETGSYPMNISLNNSIPSGSYMLRLSSNGVALTQNVVVIK